MRRRHFEEDQENHERWLVSYADFITLLFAFFVVMYAISSVNQNKYTALTSSLGSAFGGSVENGKAAEHSAGGETPAPGARHHGLIKPLDKVRQQSPHTAADRAAMTGLGNQLSLTLAPLLAQGKVDVVPTERGLRIDIHDNLLFEPGSAALSAPAFGPLREIAGLLKPQQNLVQIEGHTDNVAIHNERFFSNWELSAVRASTLVRLFAAEGVAEARLSAIGYGASQPLADNTTAAGRSKNRRVAIVISYEKMPLQKPATSPP